MQLHTASVSRSRVADARILLATCCPTACASLFPAAGGWARTAALSLCLPTNSSQALPICAPLLPAAVRPGLDGSPYLYTLNMSCPQELWGDLQAAFQRGVDSFTCVWLGASASWCRVLGAWDAGGLCLLQGISCSSSRNGSSWGCHNTSRRVAVVYTLSRPSDPATTRCAGCCHPPTSMWHRTRIPGSSSRSIQSCGLPPAHYYTSTATDERRNDSPRQQAIIQHCLPCAVPACLPQWPCKSVNVAVDCGRRCKHQNT